ncbi:hypothetical protein D3C85_1222380 [compost metagenome]
MCKLNAAKQLKAFGKNHNKYRNKSKDKYTCAALCYRCIVTVFLFIKAFQANATFCLPVYNFKHAEKSQDNYQARQPKIFERSTAFRLCKELVKFLFIAGV